MTDIQALANSLASSYAAAEAALTQLEADAKAYQRGLTASVGAIPPVTWTEIRGSIAGAAALVARSHLAVTPFDVRPRPMDGGGGK